MKYLLFCSVKDRLGEVMQPSYHFGKRSAIGAADSLLDYKTVTRVRVKKATTMEVIYDTKERG